MAYRESVLLIIDACVGVIVAAASRVTVVQGTLFPWSECPQPSLAG